MQRVRCGALDMTFFVFACKGGRSGRVQRETALWLLRSRGVELILTTGEASQGKAGA